MNLRPGNSGEEVVLLQRSLNELLKKSIKCDGDYGKITEELVKVFQTRNRFPINGLYGPQEQTIIEPFIKNKYIRLSDIDEVASRARLPISVVKAIRTVEAKGSGFLNDGRVIILFERHKFYSEYLKRFGQEKVNQITRLFPSICNPKAGGYKGNEGEYPRIEKAISIHEECALLSASYGLFQIMGFNYKAAGYSSVSSFVEAMKKSERLQLEAVISFIKADRRLKAAVENKDFNKIAEYYNGSNYAADGYHIKLKNADRLFA